jgi:hypothetical protein
MKVTVITDANGEVVGMVRHSEGHGQGAKPQPYGSFRLVAGPGQTSHEIELPSHLEGDHPAEDIHRGLKTHLKNTKRI